jgi:hypothetical protein
VGEAAIHILNAKEDNFMRKKITRDQIRANLKKEYGTKPGRKAIAAMAAGGIVGVLCFGTGRLPATLIGIVFLIMGMIEYYKSRKIIKQLDQDEFDVREGICIEKKIGNSQAGVKKCFCFDEKNSYTASAQDTKLWDKTKEGDGFYLIYFHGSDKIKKVYPKKSLAYEAE